SAPAARVGDIAALDGVFIAARRSVLEKIRWDEQTFDGWHCYDTDFTFTAHRAGFKLAVACDIPIIHQSVGNPDKVWEHYMQRFHRKHLARLYPMPRREFVTAQVRVRSKQ